MRGARACSILMMSKFEVPAFALQAMAGRRSSKLILPAILIWFAVLLTVWARAKPFWHDEVYTILEARLPVATLWRASIDGLDLSPPLSSIAVHFVQMAGGVGPVVTRIPSMAAFLAAAGLLFVMVRRRTNTIVALAAVLALYSSQAWIYAIEARGYALTVGMFALALYAWSEAAAGRHATRNWVLLSIAAAGSVWSHYYAVLICIPIVVGELVRQSLRHRFDPSPWVAFIAAAAVSLPLARLVSAGSGQVRTFWAQPKELGISDLYQFLRGDLDLRLSLIAILIGIAAIELVRRAVKRDWPRRLPAHETAAALVCVALPAVAALFGYALHAFDRRYAVFATLGLAWAIPTLVWVVTPRNRLGDLILAVAVVLPFFTLNVRTFRDPSPWPPPYATRPVLEDWLRGSDPIVIAAGVNYLGLWYYAPDDAKPRALYLADPAGQLRDTKTDTSDRGYLALARWTPVSVVPIADYVRAHPHFWLYSADAGWIEHTLRLWNATLVDRNSEPDQSAILYEVTMPARGTTSK
jgi:dolichyl-phosphate-mannose-protein mannosyltransferase